MKLKTFACLPWKIKEVVRATRRDIAESRQTMAELLRIVSALAVQHENIDIDLRNFVTEHRELTDVLKRDRLEGQARDLDREKQRERAMAWLSERLLAEIREQGLLTETAARLPSRAAAEMKLRDQLSPPGRREAGVSVLITCWNHASFIRLAVDSAIATLESLPAAGEVIILDDASRDGSRELVQELASADERIRLISSGENVGLGRARNVLLSQARFKHAMILDSDNQLVPSGVVTLYESALRTEAVLAYGNIAQVDLAGLVTGVISNERLSANLLNDNWIDAMALVRTDRMLELGGYDYQWLYGLEDWELNQRLFSLGEPMVFVPILVGKYTISPLSMLHEAPALLRHRRARRVFSRGGVAESVRYRACIHHPAVGTLWASEGWSSHSLVATTPAVARRARSRLKALVVSSGGVQNYGDDAILLSTLQRLGRVRPDCLALVVSDGPHCPAFGRLGAWAGTCEEFVAGLNLDDVRRGCRHHHGLTDELLNRVNVGPHSRTDLRSFDVVIFAGGGNLNSHFPQLIAWRAAIAAAAHAAGVPYILTGQGVGPISAEIIPMLAFLAGTAAAVATRDPLSLQLLRQLVTNGPPMDMVGDDALGLRMRRACGCSRTARPGRCTPRSPIAGVPGEGGPVRGLLSR